MDSPLQKSNVVMLSTDERIFERGSNVQDRMIHYEGIADELHIIVISRSKYETIKLTNNVYAYSATSFFRILALGNAIRLGRKIIRGKKGQWIVSAQDPFETGFVGWRITKDSDARLQLQIHTDFLSPYFVRHSLKNRIRVIIAKYLLPKADCIRVVSKRIKDLLKELRIKNYELRTKILPIYTDVKKFEGEKKFDLHEKYPQFTFLMLMISRLEEEKNISLALHALKDIVVKYPKTGLIVVGDGGEYSNLRREANRLGVSGNVVFEGWQSDLVSYYKSANVFLSTSFYEGYGNTFIEAALSGCPIVSTDVGIMEDVLKDGESALVCRIGDKKCIVGKLTKLIENNQLRSDLAQNAKVAALDHINHSWSEYLKKYQNALRACLKTY